MFSVQQRRCMYEYDSSEGISAGSESVGSRLMCGDEVLGSHKHTMRKKPFTFFAWKTAQMYEFII